MRRTLLSLAVLAAVLVVPIAHAGPGLIVGVNDDAPKWNDDPVLTAAAADLGIGAYRVTMGWDGSQTSLSSTDRLPLDRAVNNLVGRRVLLSVFGRPDVAPGRMLRAPPTARTSATSSPPTRRFAPWVSGTR